MSVPGSNWSLTDDSWGTDLERMTSSFGIPRNTSSSGTVIQLTLGGSSDENASLGDRLGPGLAQEDVPSAIEAIVDQYLDVRQEGERFLDTYRRVGIAPFKDAVYDSADSKEVA